MKTALAWAGAFAALFLTDICWALYVSAVKQGSAIGASCWALALFVLGAYAVIGYTKNRWLLIPSAVGAFAGTWAGVALSL